MNRITPTQARAARIRANMKLVDVAQHAGCAPATVRSFEFGAPVRPSITARLIDAYRALCGAADESR